MDYSKDPNNQFRGKERVVHSADGTAYHRDGQTSEEKTAHIVMNVLRVLLCIAGGYFIDHSSSIVVWGFAILIPLGFWQTVTAEAEAAR